MKSLTTVVLFASVIFAGSAFAQKSAIEGTALGADGRPQKNAQVRIQMENGKSQPTIAKTDAKGHYVASGLAVGKYTVTVLVDGVAKASMTNVKTVPEKTMVLNIDGRKAAAVNATVASSKKKYAPRWIPSGTGTHMGGHWEDDPRGGYQGAGSVEQMSTDQLTRTQTVRGNSGSAGGR